MWAGVAAAILFCGVSLATGGNVVASHGYLPLFAVHISDGNCFRTRLFGNFYMGLEPGREMEAIEWIDPNALVRLGYPSSWMTRTQLRQPTYEHSDFHRLSAVPDVHEDVIFFRYARDYVSYIVNATIRDVSVRDLDLGDRGALQRVRIDTDQSIDYLDGRAPLSIATGPIAVIDNRSDHEFVFCPGHERIEWGGRHVRCYDDPWGPVLTLHKCGTNPFACTPMVRLTFLDTDTHKTHSIELECLLQLNGLHLHVDPTLLPSVMSDRSDAEVPLVHVSMHSPTVYTEPGDEPLQFSRGDDFSEAVSVDGIHHPLLIRKNPNQDGHRCVIGTDAIVSLAWEWTGPPNKLDAGTLTVQRAYRNTFEQTTSWGLTTFAYIMVAMVWYFLPSDDHWWRWVYELTSTGAFLLHLIIRVAVFDYQPQRHLIHSNGYIGIVLAHTAIAAAMVLHAWAIIAMVVRPTPTYGPHPSSNNMNVRALFFQAVLAVNLVMDVSQTTSVRFFTFVAMLIGLVGTIIIIYELRSHTVFHVTSYGAIVPFGVFIYISSVIPFVVIIDVFRILPILSGLYIMCLFVWTGLYSHSVVITAVEDKL